MSPKSVIDRELPNEEAKRRIDSKASACTTSPLDGLDPSNLGTHKIAFMAALCCKNAGLSEEAAVDEIQKMEMRTPRPFRVREVEEAVTNAYNPKSSIGSGRRVLWPMVSESLRQRVIAGGGNLEMLRAASPIHCEDRKPSAAEILETLFPGDPLICCGSFKHGALTRRLSGWGEFLPRLQFLVPSPMLTESGLTQDGKPSPRSLQNTGPRRFLVIEGDKGTADEQAAILLHLGKKWPMALVMHSGGKSLHGWYFVHGYPENRVERFMKYAVSLGVDRATWTKNQFVRMPWGVRRNSLAETSGPTQAVHFFNPAVII